MEDNNTISNSLTKDYDDIMKKINSILRIICAIIFCFIIYACIKLFSNDSSIAKYWIIGILSIILIITIYRVINHNTYDALSSYMKTERKFINFLWFIDFYKKKDDYYNPLDIVKYELDDYPFIDRYIYGSVPIYVMINLGYILLIISMYGFMSTYDNIILFCICLVLGGVLIVCPRFIASTVIDELANKIEQKNNAENHSYIDKKKKRIIRVILLLVFIVIATLNIIFYKQIALTNLLLLDLLTITIIAVLFYIICSVIKDVRLKKKIEEHKKNKELKKEE